MRGGQAGAGRIHCGAAETNWQVAFMAWQAALKASRIHLRVGRIHDMASRAGICTGGRTIANDDRRRRGVGRDAWRGRRGRAQGQVPGYRRIRSRRGPHGTGRMRVDLPYRTFLGHGHHRGRPASALHPQGAAAAGRSARVPTARSHDPHRLSRFQSPSRPQGAQAGDTGPVLHQSPGLGLAVSAGPRHRSARRPYGRGLPFRSGTVRESGGEGGLCRPSHARRRPSHAGSAREPADPG